MRSHLGVLLSALVAALLASAAQAGSDKRPPRFEDYSVTEGLKGTPVTPVLTTSEELRYRTVIRRGVAKGWGAIDGATGDEMKGPDPNFAGHYFIVTWGCGSPCLMAAIVDGETWRVYPPPFHHGPGYSYFQVP